MHAELVATAAAEPARRQGQSQGRQRGSITIPVNEGADTEQENSRRICREGRGSFVETTDLHVDEEECK